MSNDTGDEPQVQGVSREDRIRLQIQAFDGPVPQHNFTDVDPMLQWELASTCTSPDCPDSDAALKKGKFELKYWYVHKVPVKDKESGDEVLTQRVVLIDSGNNCYGFVSNGIYDSLVQFISIMGVEAMDKPPMIEVKQSKMASGHKMLSFEPCFDKK